MGKDGGEKGYGGITKCISIEFDTYENYSQSEDPNGNHISVQSRGMQPNSSHHRFSFGCATELPSKINDGNIHSIFIAFDIPKSKCIIEFDDQLVLYTTIRLQDLIQSPTAFFGFTAGTGGITQTHCIKLWNITRPNC